MFDILKYADKVMRVCFNGGKLSPLFPGSIKDSSNAAIQNPSPAINRRVCWTNCIATARRGLRNHGSYC